MILQVASDVGTSGRLQELSTPHALLSLVKLPTGSDGYLGCIVGMCTNGALFSLQLMTVMG